MWHFIVIKLIIFLLHLFGGMCKKTTISDDLKKKNETQNVDSFNNDAESLTIVLNYSKTSIQKIIYRDNRTNAFLFTLTVLKLVNEIETKGLFTKLNDKVGGKKFVLTGIPPAFWK